MAVAFSSNEEECMNRKVHIAESVVPIPNEQLEEYYELNKCAEWIRKNGFTNVGLQFPNNSWPDRASIEKFLRKNTQSTFWNLDVPHTRCCFNEKHTTRHNLQGMIRFGHSCLMPHIIHFPVLYIFGKKFLDCKSASEEFKKSFPDTTSHVIILYEVFFSHIMRDFLKKLQCDYQNIVLSRLIVPKHQVSSEKVSSELPMEEISDNNCNVQSITKCGRCLELPSSKVLCDYDVFYIGSDNTSLKNLMVSFSNCKFFCYDPSKKIAERNIFDINRYLRQRYHYVERAKDAKVFCIVISSTTLPNCLVVIEHLRNIILKSGKQSRQLHLTEELSTHKLGNYLGIDVFVYVACSEASLVDSRSLYQTVITPYELEIALNKSREWTDNYVTDYNELLPGGCSYVPLTVRDETEADVSLITGRSRTVFSEDNDTSGSSVAIRAAMNIAKINSSAEFLASRSWRGLEQHLGETPVAEITQGMKGIASGYEGEGKQSSLSQTNV